MINLIIFASIFGVFLFILLGIQHVKNEQNIVSERLVHLSPLEAKQGEILKGMNQQGSFYQRVLFPIAQSVYPLISRFIPFGEYSWAHQKLEQAGYRESKYVQIFYGMQFLCALGGGGLLFFEGFLFTKTIGLVVIFLTIMGAIFGALGPMLIVSSMAGKRQKLIQLSLPDFLELLVICVEAGLSLDMAIQKIILSQKANEKTAPMRKELSRYLSDIEFGKSRRDALLGLADRTGLDDFRVL